MTTEKNGSTPFAMITSISKVSEKTIHATILTASFKQILNLNLSSQKNSNLSFYYTSFNERRDLLQIPYIFSENKTSISKAWMNLRK